MDARIQRYVAAAEPGTLVSLFASAPTKADTRPNGQVPFWLMALDAVRIAVFNALALLTTDPAAHERALAEVRMADEAHGRARSPLSPTSPSCAPACSTAFGCGPRPPCSCESRRPRRTGTAKRCRSAQKVLIPVAAHHRARRLPHANRFAPDLWLDGSADADWQMNVFSRGGAQCAGRNLALLLGTASLAELLRQREFELLSPKLAPDRPLPYGINPLNVRFAVRGTR